MVAYKSHVFDYATSIFSDIQEFYEESLQDNENEFTEPSGLKTREPFPPVNEWNFTGPPSTTGPTETVPSINAQSKEVSRILMCMLPLRPASLHTHYMDLECLYWF